MARAERSVDASLGVCERFAVELRQLRHTAGSPTYRTLAKRAHFSATTLSEAAAGRRLPSLAVVLAYVEACGGDRQEWQDKWNAAALAVSGDCGPAETESGQSPPSSLAPADDPDPVSDSEAGSAPAPPPDKFGRYRRPLVAVAAAVVLAVVGAVWLLPSAPSAPAAALASAASASTTLFSAPSATDGSDPKASGCAVGGTTLAGIAVKAAGAVEGVLELRYSPGCRAGWARYTPTAGSAPQSVSLSVGRPATGTKSTYQVQVGQLAIFTDLLLTGPGCLVAEAVVEQGGQTVTGATPCLSGLP